MSKIPCSSKEDIRDEVITIIVIGAVMVLAMFYLEDAKSVVNFGIGGLVGYLTKGRMKK